MSTPATAKAQPTLLFIPDISGFTEFVNHTEITHSQHIIEELLEALIDANEIGLQVSEIEGDAILFYRQGPPPTAAELLAQVQRMYVRFHALIRRYDTHRICQCGACSTGSGLKLKFIAHYGEVSMNKVKEHSKLFGKDVIVLHRLMKNRVEHEEYVVLTHDLINACTSWVEVRQASWAEPETGEEDYDFGPVTYCAIPLQALQAHVPEPRVEDYTLPGRRIQVQDGVAVLEAPIATVFNVVSDVSARHLWQAGLVGSDRLNHKIPQVGVTHRCVMQDNEKDPFLVSHSYETGQDFITFNDTELRQGWTKVWTLRKLGPGTTRIEHHIFANSWIGATLFRLMWKRVLDKADVLSYHKLNDYCKSLVADEREHPAQIVLQMA